MMNEREVAIIPVNRAIFTKEWLLIFLLSASGVLLWITPGFDKLLMPAKNSGQYVIHQGIKELEVTFLDVGQGDSIFIRTPSGHTILVDAGPGAGKYSRFDAGTQVVLPFLRSRKITRLDTVVLTHPHSDHYGGMIPVINAMEIGEFLDPGMEYPSEGYENLLKTLLEKKIPYRTVRAPKTLTWDPDMLIQVLWPEESAFIPPDPNNNSIVLRIVYGDNVYLLPGDIETSVESQLYAYGKGLRTTIFKVPHHGSVTSSSLKFLELMSPRLVIMMLGVNNKFGLPDPEIENRFQNLGIPVLRTDRNGTIMTLCDGKRVTVQPEMGTPLTVYPFPGLPAGGN